jgi:glycosyltransferase involved in cell wall biosynthesis
VCNSKTTQRFAQKNPIFSKFETLVVPCKVKKEGDISTPCNSCDYCSKGGPITEFLLAVGTVEPRKNYDRLIQGWKKSRSNSSFRNLVIVGRPGWKSYQTQKKIYNDSSIIWISPCDYGLSHLFRTASAFISASLAEGFDIPSVNAEFYGIPSALSAIDAHFEFCKSAKVFFDPNSVNEVHLAINRLSAESRSDGFRPLDIDWQRDFHQLAKRIGIEKNLKA